MIDMSDDRPHVEVYDRDGQGFYPVSHGLRFKKAMAGGEDVSLTYIIDRSSSRDWPDVGYGYTVILRNGLDALWRGTIRQIEQDQEQIVVTAIGGWVYLDDFCYDNELDAAVDLETLAGDVVTKVIAMGAPISTDTSLIEAVTLDLNTLYFAKKETCYAAMSKAADYGDQAYKAVAWGVESGGLRVFVRRPDRDAVRYIIEPAYASRLSAKGDTTRDFATSAWVCFAPRKAYSVKYYAHVTNDGIVVNGTATGDDLASNVYGISRDAIFELGDIQVRTVAVDMLQKWLGEHAHPQVASAFQVWGGVKDLMAGGAFIKPYEMKMGYLVQIPWFRAAEAEGAAASDIRDWDTTFMLAGIEWEDEIGRATLYPEGATEDLNRLISYTRLLQQATANAEAN